MTPNVELAHLYALRVHLDAVILAVETGAGISQPVTDPGGCLECGAPAEQVEDASTLDGTRRNRCTKCGAEWDRT